MKTLGDALNEASENFPEQVKEIRDRMNRTIELLIVLPIFFEKEKTKGQESEN